MRDILIGMLSDLALSIGWIVIVVTGSVFVCWFVTKVLLSFLPTRFTEGDN